MKIYALLLAACGTGLTVGFVALCLTLVSCGPVATPAAPVAPDCLYEFRVVGEPSRGWYCATQMVMPPVPSHLCFLTPGNTEVCLPLKSAISRRGL